MPSSNRPSCERTARLIGVALFNGFALPRVAGVVEVFHAADDIAGSAKRGETHYDICLLSTAGGRIASSSSVFVWTDSVETHHHLDTFHALFIADGMGLGNALRDERLIAWLRRTCSRTESIFPIGEGRLLLEVSEHRPATSGLTSSKRVTKLLQNAAGAAPVAEPEDPLRIALSIIQKDLGIETARQTSARVTRSVEMQFTAIVRQSASVFVSERIQKSARWLEANSDRPVAIDDAAQIAAMSERSFLRRFKMEMGVTPSDYLLYIRLDMSCRLLVETNLPIDKIARRCGIGSGGQLSKLFRKHLAATPTEYRTSKRAERGLDQGSAV
ncbi:helix-turn-helix domain-containing protein [Trinickia sp. YCB016]